MNPTKIPFTREAYEKMAKDLQELELKRKEILVRLQAAREMGDLSENGAYHGARFELSTTDRELRRLAYLLKNGEVGKTQNQNTVGFGCKVVLDNGSQKLEFTMVSKFESDPIKKKLSIQSPLGEAIVGKAKGEKVIVEAPGGKTSYTILDVDY
jgi:transcription elongation factor GreA